MDDIRFDKSFDLAPGARDNPNVTGLSFAKPK